MIENASFDYFREELHSRQKELVSDCISNNIELESFARASTEILCDSGSLLNEPEFLFLNSSVRLN